MKICAACSQSLPKDEFSKKQWQLKHQRRCKECITVNREVNKNLDAPNDAPASSCTNDEGTSVQLLKGLLLQTLSCAVSEGETASSFTDDDLFKQCEPNEECPVCFVTLPTKISMIQYQVCCGKMLCIGCIYAAFTADDRRLCPFCRTPYYTSDEEYVKRIKKRVEGNDAMAMRTLGCHYDDGSMGLPQNLEKAMKLFLRAGELGCTIAYSNIGNAYKDGHGVERDTKKAKYY